MTHRNILLGTFLFFASVFLASGQCVVPAGFVCLTAEQADKTNQLIDKYQATKEALTAAEKQITTLNIASATKDSLIASLRDLGTIQNNLDAAKDKYILILKAMNDLQTDLIARQQKQLSKGKSSFDKFLNALKVLYYTVATAVLVL